MGIQAKKKQCDGPCNSLKFIWKNDAGKKYCRQCWSAQTKATDTKPTGRQKPIPARSSRRIKEEAKYSKRRKIFLLAHPMCEARISQCTGQSTEVHHKKGRSGSLYLDETHWLAACHNCHCWIELNPIQAKEAGLSESRLQ